MSKRSISEFKTRFITLEEHESVLMIIAYYAGEDIKDTAKMVHFDAREHSTDVIYKKLFRGKGSYVKKELEERELFWSILERTELELANTELGPRGDEKTRLAFEFYITFPLELAEEAKIALAKQFVQLGFADYGMDADLFCHYGVEDGEVPHCHILVPIRKVGTGGVLVDKRGYIRWNKRGVLKRFEGLWRALAQEQR